MKDTPDRPRLVELHAIPLAKNRGSFPKISVLCIHKTSGAQKWIDKLIAAGDTRFNIDLIQLDMSWKTLC